MSAGAQFDLHPDAERLNAFAENELPAKERTDVMAHLAGCGRCREVVFLAQEALAAESPALQVAAPTAQQRPERRRFNVWMWGWAAAAAVLLCVAAITVSVRMRREAAAPQATTMAEVRTPANAISQVNGPERAAKAGAAPEKSRAVRQGAAEAAVGAIDMRGRNAAELTPMSPAPKSAPTPRVEADSLEAASEAAKSQQAQAGARMGMASNRAHGPSVPQQNQMQNFAAQQSQGLEANAPMPAPPPPAAGMSESYGKAAQSASQTVEVTADKAEKQPPAVHGTSYVAPGQSEGNGTGALSGLMMLPSKLPMISTVGAGKVTLAIDAMGAMFVSHDLGKTWGPVEQTWKGKAVKVRLALPESIQDERAGFLKKQEKEKPASGAATVGAVFEVVNDKNAVWTSADGKTWSEK